jgi:hypothetical protein
MNCCNDFGQCVGGHDCPARTRTTTPREDVEKLLGVWSAELGPAKPAKVGKRYPAAPSWAPSHWPKTLKALAKWMLIVAVASMAMGFIVGVFA